jgi:hypothetical protein
MRSLDTVKDQERKRALAPQEDQLEAEHDPEVSRRASLADLRRHEPVQQKAAGQDAGNEQVHAAAEQGVAAPATQLPHADKIQAAFGAGHDVSAIQAHVGGNTAGAMNAQAYATGNHVVFDKQPDLHTAAHEAAHVVQQARGVNLYGGVGDAGDRYEANADAVADRVVAGESAADLLGPATKGAAPAQSGAVQHKKEPKDVAETTKEERRDQHGTAEVRTYWAIQHQITLVAAKLHDGANTVDHILGMTSFDASGGAREAQMIQDVFTSAHQEVSELHGRLSSSAADIAGLQNQLGKELGQLQGAVFRFATLAGRADGFIAKLQHAPMANAKARDIRALETQIYALFGADPAHLRRDMTDLSASLASEENEAIKGTLDALWQSVHAARMDAHYDLENGSKQVKMAGRRAKEAQELLTESTDKKKGTKYKADLKKVHAEVEKLSDESPNLYMDVKSSGLAETIAAMQKIK